MGWSEVEEKFQREVGAGFRGGEQHFETQLIRAVVFCHRGRGNVFLTRGKRETAAGIIDGYLTKKRSAEGTCLPFTKTWKRCESCWQGGNLKKKRAEKDLSGSQIQPIGPLIIQEAKLPLCEPKGCPGYHPCHGPSGPGQLCEGERKSKMKRDWRPARRTGERTKRRRRRDLKAAGKCCAGAPRRPTVCLNWRKGLSYMCEYICIHLLAKQNCTNKDKNVFSGKMTLFFGSEKECVLAVLQIMSVLGFSSAKATSWLYFKVS